MPTVTKITLARLFNTGSYEHVRYEITVEVKEGESAEHVITNLERVMEALRPECKSGVSSESDLEHEKRKVESLMTDLASLSEGEFRHRHGFFEGTPTDYVTRCNKAYFENVVDRKEYKERAVQARKLLDDLGGTATWKDAKLDWE